MYPSISLCMIVKNEEDWLEQCLSSVQPIISEIIFVDTGSTDRSIELAKKFGAKLFDFNWVDDFSAARNFSLKQAIGDWIFVLDPDEAIAEKDLKVLQEQTLVKGVVYEFLQRHYTSDHRLSDFRPCVKEYSEWERDYPGYFESNLSRMFPNHMGIEYRGRIHELVEHSVREKRGLKVVRTNVPIHHYGHTNEVKAKKAKAKLYSPLGVAKTKEMPRDWKAFHELGVEHNCNLRYAEAAESFAKAVQLKDDYIDTWINYGYVLCELARYEEAVKALIKAISLDPKNEQSYCNLAVVHMRQKQFAKAAEILIQAVNLNPLYVNALCNLGVSFAHIGRFSESANAYLRAIEAMPQCITAKSDLGALYLNSGEFEESEKILLSAIKDSPDYSRAYINLASLYKIMKRNKEAANTLEAYLGIEEVKDPVPSQERQSQSESMRAEIAELRGKA